MALILWILIISYVLIGVGLVATLASGLLDVFVLLAVLFAALAAMQRYYFSGDQPADPIGDERVDRG